MIDFTSLHTDKITVFELNYSLVFVQNFTLTIKAAPENGPQNKPAVLYFLQFFTDWNFVLAIIWILNEDKPST